MSAEWLDLAQPLFNGMARAQAHGDVSFWVDEHLRSGLAGPPSVRVTHLRMAAHVGTHVDAARHFIADGKTIDAYPPSFFMGPGVALDLRREGVVPVTADDLAGCTPTVQRGDIVLVYFGYAERFQDPSYHDHPYFTADAADWLLERGVRILGVDTVTPDLPGAHRPDSYDFPIHMRLLGNDVLIIENLGPNLSRLLGHRLHVLAVPFAIEGGDASPIIPLARIDDAQPSPTHQEGDLA
jgi:arylformamidase